MGSQGEEVEEVKQAKRKMLLANFCGWNFLKCTQCADLAIPSPPQGIRHYTNIS